MLDSKFDPEKPNLYVRYGRFSDEEQNPRSPKQQLDTIDSVLARLRYPWVHVRDYVDDAITGRYLMKRENFWRMLTGIRQRLVHVDLILVDTSERFARAEEMKIIRQELEREHGVLILTANTNFADPTTTQGRAYSAMDEFRAIEENRVKAHQVLRGKRDAARQGHWPGGPPPFGCRLVAVMVTKHGRELVDYCVLAPDPETAWIIKKLYELAATGLGSTLLTRMLNGDPTIPHRFKPFQEATIRYWLKNEIYYGELVWEKHATDIVSDCRVIERNAEEDFLRVPNFCEPLVPRTQWDIVQELCRVRSERARAARAAADDTGGKQIAALAPGLSLHYLLSGLVQCAHCNRAMVASSSPKYVNKSGESKRYTAYVCPGYAARICPNGTRVPEAWLRQAVVGHVRSRLLPGPQDAI